MNDLISVILPIYNVKEYLKKCVNSILNQTYNKLEIILVDDGSTDGSSNICDEFEKADSRIRVIHKSNGGLSDARNNGIKHAKGKYIMLIDSDDYIDSNTIESLYNNSQKYKADISICNFIEEDIWGNVLRDVNYDNKIYKFDGIDSIKELLSQKLITNHAWNKLYKADLFKNIEYPKGQLMEDINTTYKLFEKSKSVVFQNSPMYHYLQRSNSILGNVTLKRILDQDYAIYDRNEYLKENYPELSDAIAIDYISNCKSIYYLSIISGNYKIINEKLSKRYVELKKEFRKHKEFFKNDFSGKIFYFNKSLYRILIKTKYNFKKTISEFKKNLINSFRDLWIEYKILKSKKTLPETNKNRIFIFLAADYPNYGDIAITYAQKLFLNDLFNDYEILEVKLEDTLDYIKPIKHSITNKDIITIVGGGNMGDMYAYYEELRRTVIKKFKSSFIISFPQTIDFSNTRIGNKLLKKTKRVIKRANNIMLMAREEKSFGLMKSYFGDEKVFLEPDIAIYLKNRIKINTHKSKLVGLCFRKDNEKSKLSSEVQVQIKKQYKNVEYFDTYIDDEIFIYENREEKLMDLINKISQYDIIYTDRLHAMILAYVSNTRCKFLDNSNSKLSGVYKCWLADSNIESIKGGKVSKSNDVDKAFEELKNIILEKYNG